MALSAFQKKVQETHRVIFIRNLAFGKSHGHDYYGSAIKRYWNKFMWWKLVSIVFAGYICKTSLLPLPLSGILFAQYALMHTMQLFLQTSWHHHAAHSHSFRWESTNKESLCKGSKVVKLYPYSILTNERNSISKHTHCLQSHSHRSLQIWWQ